MNKKNKSIPDKKLSAILYVSGRLELDEDWIDLITFLGCYTNTVNLKGELKNLVLKKQIFS